jgi:ATP-binding cassette subfamily B protein
LPRRRRIGLSRLLVYTRGKGRLIAVLAVVSALAAAAPVAGWLLLGRAIDAANEGALGRLTAIVVAYVVVNLAGWALGTVVWRGLAGLGQGVVLDLRRDLFGHLTSLSLRYFSQQRAGWIIARLTSDVDALSDVLSQGLATLTSNVLMLIAAVGGLFLLDWRLGLVALVVLPPGLVVTRWFQRRSHAAFADVRTRIAAVTAQLAESVAGMAIVQAFNRERAFQAEFDALNDANRASNTRAQKISAVSSRRSSCSAWSRPRRCSTSAPASTTTARSRSAR